MRNVLCFMKPFCDFELLFTSKFITHIPSLPGQCVGYNESASLLLSGNATSSVVEFWE